VIGGREADRQRSKCQKRPITVSRETYYSVKRDLLYMYSHIVRLRWHLPHLHAPERERERGRKSEREREREKMSLNNN